MIKKIESIKLGLDLGMSSTKLVGIGASATRAAEIADDGSTPSRLREILFYNQCALMNGERMEGSLTGMKQRRRPMVVKGEFGEFYVGKGAHDFGQPVESFDFEHLTGTNEMRALVYGALTMYQKQFGAFDAPLACSSMAA